MKNRKHADECRALAAKMDQPDQRDQLLNMAQQWDALAGDRRRFQPSEQPRAISSIVDERGSVQDKPRS